MNSLPVATAGSSAPVASAAALPAESRAATRPGTVQSMSAEKSPRPWDRASSCPALTSANRPRSPASGIAMPRPAEAMVAFTTRASGVRTSTGALSNNSRAPTADRKRTDAPAGSTAARKVCASAPRHCASAGPTISGAWKFANRTRYDETPCCTSTVSPSRTLRTIAAIDDSRSGWVGPNTPVHAVASTLTAAIPATRGRLTVMVSLSVHSNAPGNGPFWAFHPIAD